MNSNHSLCYYIYDFNSKAAFVAGYIYGELKFKD